MIRRVAFLVKNYRTLVNRTSRAISDKPDQQTPKEPAQPAQPEAQKVEEDPSAYEDYGDVKIRRGGRTIKVDESEHVGGSLINICARDLTWMNRFYCKEGNERVISWVKNSLVGLRRILGLLFIRL